MQHKWINILVTLVLWSVLLLPASKAQAQGTPPACPPYEEGILNNKAFLDALPSECVSIYKVASRRVEREPAPAAADGIAPALTGGPDAFGYTFDNTVPFSWVNAATNAGLTGDDEFAGPIGLGFSFPFYGTPQTQLYFNTNGLITFGAGTTEWGAYPVPSDILPNNYIAPFWDDLLVGSPHNSGAIYYSRGGSAPNRYFVIEWRNVENYDGVGVFSFEAILHENGDIVVLHKSLPSDYYSTVGIEDESGYEGLQYQYGNGNLSSPRAIRFYHPTPAARVLAYPVQRGGFVSLGGQKDFSIIVRNQGALGTDTYEISETNNWPWPVTYYASNGITPLADTNGNTVIDTGPIAQGASATILARYHVPDGAQIGDANFPKVNFTSTLNPGVEDSVTLYMSIPAGFANVFVDDANGAMSFFTASAAGTKLSKATANNYFGYHMAVAPLTNGNYFYAWNKLSSNGLVGNIEYALLDRQGNPVLSPRLLTNNVGASVLTTDRAIAVGVAPNGTVGVVWIRYLYNPSTDKDNYNVFFVTLDATGTRLTGPTNLTNNAVWGNWDDLNIPEFRNTTIAATSDNRFLIGWEEQILTNSYLYVNDLWYAVRNTSGAQVLAPKALTTDGENSEPVLNPLAGGKAIMTWYSHSSGSHYAVIDSNGVISKPKTLLNADAYSTDAVQLPNGNVAVAWGTWTGVQFAILDSSHNLLHGPTEAASPNSAIGDGLSVTTDVFSRVIMTWIDTNSYNKLFYALGHSDGGFLTPPMYYTTSGGYMDVSWDGQGLAPYQTNLAISGNAGVAGLSLHYTDGMPETVTSQMDGSYSLTVPEGWSGTVTPIHPCFTFSPESQNYSNVSTHETSQDYTPTPAAGCADIDVSIGTTTSGRFGILSEGSTRASFTGVNNGPVKIESTNVVPLLGAERLIYKVSNVATSFTEMMALPDKQLDQVYWLPWYNNNGVDLDTQLRFANVTDQTAMVQVFIGGEEMTGCTSIPAMNYPYELDPGESVRVSCAGVNDGPVEIRSDVNIVTAERLIYKVGGVNTSFSEMMALPASQLDNVYWLPWYNNNGKDLDTQLRIANVTDETATVQLFIGDTEATACTSTPAMNYPYVLDPGESVRVSCAGVNDGPVQIVSDQNIVAAERLIYKVGNVAVSFTEMMALPEKQLDSVYWLPWYNNNGKDLDTQLRFANTTDQEATVHIYIGGQEVTPAEGITLLPNESTRQSFTGINNGPVQIVSNVPIVAAERLIYKVNNIATSFSEMMALPASQLDTLYWLPWYNNNGKDLDTQLRFGVP